MQIFFLLFANRIAAAAMRDAKAEIQDLLPDAWILRCYRGCAFFSKSFCIMTVW